MTVKNEDTGLDAGDWWPISEYFGLESCEANTYSVSSIREYPDTIFKKS